MYSQRFTFLGNGADQISPRGLLGKLTEGLGLPCVDISHDGKRFEFGECGPAVSMVTREGYAVSASNAHEIACSFNPKPEAMAGSGIDRPHVAPAIASGFGLNERNSARRRYIQDVSRTWLESRR